MDKLLDKILKFILESLEKMFSLIDKLFVLICSLTEQLFDLICRLLEKILDFIIYSRDKIDKILYDAPIPSLFEFLIFEVIFSPNPKRVLMDKIVELFYDLKDTILEFIRKAMHIIFEFVILYPYTTMVISLLIMYIIIFFIIFIIRIIIRYRTGR